MYKEEGESLFVIEVNGKSMRTFGGTANKFKSHIISCKITSGKKSEYSS